MRPPLRLLVPLLVVGMVAGACGDDDDSGSPAASTGATVSATTVSTPGPSPTAAVPTSATIGPSPTTARTVATTTTTAPAVPAVLQVGQTTLAFEDTSRPTNEVPGQVAAAPTRPLPTLVSYPAASAGTDVPVAGGPYPLVVLSHGITANEHEYDDVFPALVAAGYVVAAPRFPETANVPDFQAFPQVINQPGDVRFVIDGLLAASADPASPLHGTIDADRIGIGGHSLGAFTSLLLAYNTQFGDPRIRAVYEASGAMYPAEGGTYDFAGKPPLLAVHGDADSVIGYAGSVDAYAAASPPKWFLTVTGGGHSTFLHAPDPALAPHNDAVVGFYDLYLKGAVAGKDQLARSAVAGVTTLQSDA